VLRLGPEVLMLLRAVDAPEANQLLPAIVEYSYAVAVDDADNRNSESAKSHGNLLDLVPISAIL